MHAIGTAGFVLKKTAEPPSGHFLQNSQLLFLRLIFLIWATKYLLLKNLNSLSDLLEQINAKKTSGLIISVTREAFKTGPL